MEQEKLYKKVIVPHITEKLMKQLFKYQKDDEFFSTQYELMFIKHNQRIINEKLDKLLNYGTRT